MDVGATVESKTIPHAALGFKKLYPDAIIPTRATERSAGYDLYALESRTIVGGEGFVLVPTGVAVKLSERTYA